MASDSCQPSIEASVILSVLERLRALQKELREADIALREHDPDDIVTYGDDDDPAARTIRRDYEYLAKELALLKKSVPGGPSEDEAFQYFLAVAELQRDVEDLREQAVVSEMNLSQVVSQYQVAENLVLQQQEINKTILENLRTKGSSNGSQARMASADEESLDRKIRSTNNVYKELKTFFGHLLTKLSAMRKQESDKMSIAELLQILWNNFFGHHRGQGPDEYVSVSHLDADVDFVDLAWLIDHGLIEKNPENEDEIRLVNFCQ